MEKNRNEFVMTNEGHEVLTKLNEIAYQIQLITDEVEQVKRDTKEEKLTLKDKYEILNFLVTKMYNQLLLLQNDTYLKLKKIWRFEECNGHSKPLQHMCFDRINLIKKIFENFGKENCSHVFVLIDGRLECVCCGCSTLDYTLTDEENKWLIMLAKEREQYVGEVSKFKLPFLRKIVMEEKENFKAYQYYSILNQAVEYDKGYSISEKGKKLSKDKKAFLICQLKEEKNLIKKNCHSNFKNLLLQECQVAQYEIEILSGESIPWLFENAKTKSEKFAIAKAYYNLSHEYFRKNSGYFQNEQEAEKFVCLTAHPEINQMILDRKVKREN